ncbi:insulin-like growth factor-binding protein complex acid labile subunit isoform X2 [Aethina tumida]|nr:insulin-like growth factor-binding protein complex acid labile subunit isoform X2 [Aethina tumida]
MLFYSILVALVATAAAVPAKQNVTECIPNCSCITRHTTLTIKECKGVLTLDKITFKNLKKSGIDTLVIDTEHINTIDANVFEQFSQFYSVVIKNAKIGVINPKAFANIIVLSFENCDFEDEPEIYSEHLEELKFVDCRLSEVPTLNCPQLTYLNLTRNFIKEVDVASFAMLQSLEDLDLSQNQISKFPDNVLINNRDLNTLYIDNNPLTYFGINTTNDIELLSLKGCQLTKFNQNATRYLDYLTALYLNDNQIDMIEGIDMAFMSSLEIFDISNNKLQKLNPDVFENNTKLKKIFLDGNDLKFLPLFVTAQGRKFDTYKFSCRRCSLSQKLHPLVFKQLSALSELYLSDNYLANVNDSFSFLHSLKILDLSNNLIGDISESAFKNNQELDTFYLSGNQLSSVDPKVFEYNIRLLVLDMSNNSLATLWRTNSTALKSIDKFVVKNNKLRTLTTDDLNVTPNVHIFDVEGNSFECSPALIDSLLWLKKKSVFVNEQITHMDMTMDEQFDEDVEKAYSWKHILQACPNLKMLFEQQEADNADDDDDDLGLDDDDDTEDFTLNNELDDKLPLKEDDEDDDYYDNYDDLGSKPSKPELESVRDLKDETVEAIEDIHYAYIFSVSLVFIITALLVLCIAVTITLLVLKKNGTFNIHRGNIPRIKIPTWSTATGLKKHSGSIYRPLSEDFSAQIPQPKHYEFSAAPTVHSTQS